MNAVISNAIIVAVSITGALDQVIAVKVSPFLLGDQSQITLPGDIHFFNFDRQFCVMGDRMMP